MALLLSILKKVLNLNTVHVEKHEVISTEVWQFGEQFEEKQIHVHLRPIKRCQNRCPVCKRVCSGYDYRSTEESKWRAANLNGIPVYLFYRRRRIQCPEHGVLSEYVPWEDGTSRFTESFNNEVAWMALQMSKKAITTLMRINWRSVGNCIQAAHKRIEPDVNARLRGLRRICVDETSYRKGHSYITVVYDMERNRVAWVHEGHGQKIFAQFCELLTEEERSQIEIVAGDGAKWIDTCTNAYFPNAKRCVDFFHVVQWANEALDQVRTDTAAKARRELRHQQEEYQKLKDIQTRRWNAARRELAALPKRGRPSKRRKELEAFLKQLETLTNLNQGQEEQTKCAKKFAFSPEEQEVLSALEKQVKDIKGAKYALSHRPENCTQTQTERLKLIENSYPDLYRAYQLKESLRLILHMKDFELAALELDSWIAEVSESGLRALQKLAEKILRHRDNILNAIHFQANSAKSESTNTTIKVLIKMARGFRNMDNMIALIYLKCSDLTIPLNNRPQPTKQYLAAMRKRASDLRLAREQSGQKYATQT